MGGDWFGAVAGGNEGELQFVMWVQAGVGEVTHPNSHQAVALRGLNQGESLLAKQSLRGRQVYCPADEQTVALVKYGKESELPR
jgi:hypothetical protein